MDWSLWIALVAILLIAEAFTQGAWALCIALGCLCASLASFFGLNIGWQLTVFFLSSIMSIVLVMPFVKKWMQSRHDRHESRTGMDALLGRKGLVTHEIKPGKMGRVQIDGDNWQAVAPDLKSTILRGTEVSVTSYDSIILTVSPH